MGTNLFFTMKDFLGYFRKIIYKNALTQIADTYP